MSDSFHGSKRAIARAKKRIAEIESALDAYFLGKPCTRVKERDPDTGYETYSYRFHADFPDDVSDTCFETVMHLRAALDRAGYVVARAHGKSGSHAHFPFGNYAAGKIPPRSKHIPPNILSLMMAFKPYKGGNEPLWALNKLANTSKHEFLCPAVQQTGRLHVRRERNIGALLIPHPKWDSSKHEIKYAILRPGAQVQADIKLPIFVALNEPATIASEPAVTVLNCMVSEVERILMAVEAEARRTRLIM